MMQSPALREVYKKHFPAENYELVWWGGLVDPVVAERWRKKISAII